MDNKAYDIFSPIIFIILSRAINPFLTASNITTMIIFNTSMTDFTN